MPARRESDLSILFELFVVSQRVSTVLKDAMGESPLTPAEYALYSLVFDTGGATPTDLSRRMGMPVTTVLDQLKEMESRSHIQRSPNPRDGRSYLVSLTRSGLQVHRQAGDDFNEAMDRISKHLRVDESQIRHTLDALGEATDAAIEDLRASLFRANAS